MSIKQIITVAAGLSLAAGAYGLGAAQHQAPASVPTNTPYSNTLHIQPCIEEDSTNCVFESDRRGNGTGNSFIDYDGDVYYLETTEMDRAMGWE